MIASLILPPYVPDSADGLPQRAHGGQHRGQTAAAPRPRERL